MNNKEDIEDDSKEVDDKNIYYKFLEGDKTVVNIDSNTTLKNNINDDLFHNTNVMLANNDILCNIDRIVPEEVEVNEMIKNLNETVRYNDNINNIEMNNNIIMKDTNNDNIEDNEVDSFKYKTQSRVKNACSNCKVRKVKCSHNRPCDNCIKKSLKCEIIDKKEMNNTSHVKCYSESINNQSNKNSNDDIDVLLDRCIAYKPINTEYMRNQYVCGVQFPDTILKHIGKSYKQLIQSNNKIKPIVGGERIRLKLFSTMWIPLLMAYKKTKDPPFFDELPESFDMRTLYKNKLYPISTLDSYELMFTSISNIPKLTPSECAMIKITGKYIEQSNKFIFFFDITESFEVLSGWSRLSLFHTWTNIHHPHCEVKQFNTRFLFYYLFQPKDYNQQIMLELKACIYGYSDGVIRLKHRMSGKEIIVNEQILVTSNDETNDIAMQIFLNPTSDL